MSKKLECQRCGKCCFNLVGDVMIVSSEDIARWIEEERWDILDYITLCSSIISGFTKHKRCSAFLRTEGDLEQCIDCFGGDLVSPYDSGRCKFLRKVRSKSIYKCLIQETKPISCSKFPVGKYEECPNSNQ